jgi:hypothetical protein
MNPNEPLYQAYTPRSGPLVKDTVQTGLTVDVSECRPELLPRSPKIHLNTSKSIFVKVDHLVEGHNFLVDWHFKF